MLRQLCDIEEVPASATDPSERVTIATDVACSDVLPITILDNTAEREPYGLATVQTDWRIYTEPNALIQEGHRLITGNVDYAIYKITPVPNGNTPAALEITMRT